MIESVRVEGLERLERKLDTRGMDAAMQGALMAIAAEVQDKLAPYPPSTAANSPASERWYERGYGQRWMRADGSLGGRKTSETLGRRWSIRSMAGRMQVILSNIASYAPFVHSEERQARFHGERGWKTDRAAISQVARSGVVERILRDAFRKWWG